MRGGTTAAKKCPLTGNARPACAPLARREAGLVLRVPLRTAAALRAFLKAV